MPHGGGGTVDQCALSETEKNGVTQRCTTSTASVRAPRKGRGRRAIFRYQEINEVTGIIFTTASAEQKCHLRSRPHSVLSVAPMRYFITNPHTLVRVPPIQREVSPETHLPLPRPMLTTHRPSCVLYVSPRRTPCSRK
jgi:hypothetical protein